MNLQLLCPKLRNWLLKMLRKSSAAQIRPRIRFDISELWAGGGLLMPPQGVAGGELLPLHDQPVQQVKEVKEGFNTEL